MCVADKCMKLVNNIVEMGSGTPPNEGQQNSINQTQNNPNKTNNSSNQTQANTANISNSSGVNQTNNSAQTNNTKSSTMTNSSAGNSTVNPNDGTSGGKGSTNNQTTTTTTPTSTGTSSNGNSGSGTNSRQTTSPEPASTLIKYTILSPTQVKSDPYFVSVYQAILPRLPETITSLNISRIEKGIFFNGTISYQIYYGQPTDSHYLTIFFVPSLYTVTYIKLTIIQNVQPTPVYPTSTCSAGHTTTITTHTYT